MKTTWISCLLAIVCFASSVDRADAAYCGVSSFTQGDGKLSTVSFSRARKGCSRCEKAVHEQIVQLHVAPVW